MPNFYIVPPRLLVGSLDRSNNVTSLNGYKGDLSISTDTSSGLTFSVSGGSFTFSLNPSIYIKKQGDTITGNIIFTPSTGNFGFAVGSGNGFPGTAVTGAIFFDTSSSSLGVYTGGIWASLTAGISLGYANSNYLRLDGTNTPNADLSMGSYLLRLANLTPRVGIGITGQIYFNTTSTSIEYYNGTAWVSPPTLSSISTGIGLSATSNPITTSGTVSINQNAQLIWTTPQTFTSGLSAGIITSPVYTSSSAMIIKPASNSVTGIQIQSAAGTTILNVDTLNFRIGINTSAPAYDLEVNGEIAATSKSFVIDHPTKPNMKLRYASLEGPENGVYFRGTANSNMIKLPDCWVGLVHFDSITVNLTPIGRFAHLYVEKIEDNIVYINDNNLNPINCFFTVYAERKDIKNLVVEF